MLGELGIWKEFRVFDGGMPSVFLDSLPTTLAAKADTFPGSSVDAAATFCAAIIVGVIGRPPFDLVLKCEFELRCDRAPCEFWVANSG